MSLLIDRIDKTILALEAERRRLRAEPLALCDAAYQGAPGAFSEDAAIAFLGSAARLQPCRTLADVIDAVIGGQVRWGVVPVENTLAGPVPGCADLLRRADVSVRDQRSLRIRHAVIGLSGATLDGIRTVRSHPVALAQCRRFLADHPAISPEPAYDTAGAVAEIVAHGAADLAAIAGRRAADVHGGCVLADDVQDAFDNFTRFVLVEVGRRA